MQRISYINGGYAFKSTKYQEKGVRIIRISDFDENGLKYKNIVRYPYSEELNPYKLEDNNILLAMTGGTVGKSYLVERVDEPMYVNQRVATIKTLPCVEIKYINATILSDLIQKIIKHSKNSTNDNISMDTICNFLIPLPPLSEQKRIVAKIEELEPFIEEYGKAETELTALNNNFPEQIKKSILQYAIQGKLVEQDPNDEPASVLLKKIKAEKADLVKQGKIKKDKQESYIYKGTDNRHYEKIGSEVRDITDEIPFDIPNSWSWCRLGSVSFVTKLAGFEYTKYIANNLVVNGIPLFKGKNIQDGKILYSFEAYIPKEISDFLIRSQVNKKCILTPYVGTIGNIAIHNQEGCFHLGSNVGKIELFNNFSQNLLEEFVLFYLKSDFGYKELTKHKKATAQESISIEAIRDVLLPIPPITEQHRIIKKIMNLMETIELL